jgi:hypothetical protein
LLPKQKHVEAPKIKSPPGGQSRRATYDEGL